MILPVVMCGRGTGGTYSNHYSSKTKIGPTLCIKF